MIGIVSHDGDAHATQVQRHLTSMGAAHLLLDTADLPGRASLSTHQDRGWAATWTVNEVSHDLGDLRAMWWRRPQPFVLPDGVTNQTDRGFIVDECAAAVAGLWTCLDATWVNDPDRDEAASRKMRQLQVAASLGLRTPRTCMTNDPDRARQFIASEPGDVIYKSFSCTPQTWRETRRVSHGDHELLDLVRLAPVIFQEAIAGGIDLRVTIIGSRVFPAQIRTQDPDHEFDFRVETDAPIIPVVLPTGVQRRLLELMRFFGLHYGAIDLRRDPDGDLVFLEINPAGQWLFVELATGQPITAALAGHLAELDRRRPTGTGVPRRPASNLTPVPTEENTWRGAAAARQPATG